MDLFSFPLFDAHMHFSQAYLREALASYADVGVVGGVNLWGGDATPGSGYCFHGDYREFLRICRAEGLDRRFAQLYWPHWTDFGTEGVDFVKALCDDLRDFASLGCRGLKVWKDLGMWTFNPDGSPVTMDDERLTPVWRTCAELGFRVALHQADPSPRFAPRCKTGLTREQIFASRDRVIASHPEVRFILCHSGNSIEDMGKFAALLDRFPYCVSDLSPMERFATVEQVRAFIERYADRLMFGADLAMPEDRPPDAVWNRDVLYAPWRRRLLDWGLSPEAFEKVTLTTGRRLFFGPTR